MIGVYDFCGHYDWTFEWLRQQGGETLVRQYWDEAIHQDSQRHAFELIQQQGFAGMATYWGHTLDHEGAGYHTSAGEEVFRIDMHDCPSKGFLLRNDLGAYGRLSRLLRPLHGLDRSDAQASRLCRESRA